MKKVGKMEQEQLSRLRKMKKQFRKAKRRLELGVAKPTDTVTLEKLAKILNYKY
jgi:hypothetical protein